MIKDNYFKKKGGTAKVINVKCAKCGNPLLIYQKDGPRGWLKRCYLNRMLYPEKFARLQDKQIKKLSDLGNLKCKCGKIIGTPIKHKDGRLAFKIVRKTVKRRDNRSKKWNK